MVKLDAVETDKACAGPKDGHILNTTMPHAKFVIEKVRSVTLT
jgi:hypothetical protein